MKKLLALLAMAAACGLWAVSCGPGEESEDAGEQEQQCPATGGPCTVPATSQCDGDLLLYCDANDKLACANCKTESGGPFVCAQFNATYGYDCLATQGMPCSPTFPNNTDNLTGCISTLTCTGGVCQ
ncbi:MAG: hypothetical protein JXR83_10050 [Deltaproteobacteria bacterium]|nr:hypothetical protein [Deltaproteobacteria bacterium]